MKHFILILSVVFLLSSVSGELQIGVVGDKPHINSEPPTTITFNNNTGTVNTSQYWGSWNSSDFNMQFIKDNSYNHTLTVSNLWGQWFYNQTTPAINYFLNFAPVVIQHGNGSLTLYPSTANTNTARGNALKSAVGNATAGDTIYMSATTFGITQTLIVPEQVSVIGSGYNTFISGTVLSSSVMLVNGSNTIRDFRIINGGNGGSALQVGRLSQGYGPSIVIQHVQFNSVFDGVWVYGKDETSDPIVLFDSCYWTLNTFDGGAIVFGNVLIKNSVVDNPQAGQSDDDGAGAWLYINSGRVTFENSHVYWEGNAPINSWMKLHNNARITTRGNDIVINATGSTNAYGFYCSDTDGCNGVVNSYNDIILLYDGANSRKIYGNPNVAQGVFNILEGNIEPSSITGKSQINYITQSNINTTVIWTTNLTVYGNILSNGTASFSFQDLNFTNPAGNLSWNQSLANSLYVPLLGFVPSIWYNDSTQSYINSSLAPPNINVTNITAMNITDSSLISGGVCVASTGGLITSPFDLTYKGNTLWVGNETTIATHIVQILGGGNVGMVATSASGFAATSPQFNFNRARGSITAKNNVSSGDRIFSIIASGYVNDVFKVLANIRVEAETKNDTGSGGRFVVSTTIPAGTATIDALIVDSNQTTKVLYNGIVFGNLTVNGYTNLTDSVGVGGNLTASYVNVTQNILIVGNLSVKRPYGMFSQNGTMTVPVGMTAYPISFNITEDSYLVYKSNDNANFSFGQTGDYLIELSIVGQSTAAGKRLNIWVQKNGVNVPRSNTPYDFKSNNAIAVIAVPFILDMNTTDKFRVMYEAPVEVSLPYVLPTANAPETPSAIMTITKISEITP